MYSQVPLLLVCYIAVHVLAGRDECSWVDIYFLSNLGKLTCMFLLMPLNTWSRVRSCDHAKIMRRYIAKYTHSIT